MAFKNIIGNEKIKNTLNTAINQKNILHSYLFSGTEGIGKLLFAKEFAKAILCENEEYKPCEVCKSCVQFKNGNHPDFYLVEPEGNSVKIDQIRYMNVKILEKPIASSKKIYIINDCEKMTTDAQNCLLKTLEEPPEYAVIILICKNESSMLATIKSRCTKIEFNNLTIEQLQTYFTSRGEEVSSQVLELAEGSISKALNRMPKQENYIKLKKLLESMGKIDKLEILKQEYIYQEKEDIQELLEMMNTLLFEIAKEKTQYLNCISIVEETKKNLKLNCNFEMSIDNLLLSIWEEVNETNSRR